LGYRLIEIDGLPKGKTYHHNLQRVRTSVGLTYGTPAALIRGHDRYYLAVALEGKKQTIPDEFDVPILQGLAARLRMVPNVVSTLDLADLTETEEIIATTFLGFALRSSLRDQLSLWQGASALQYYTKEPVLLSGNGHRPHVALYPGFSYRFLRLPEQGLCVAVDCVHVYTDTRTLAERVDAGEDWRRFLSRYFVYEFGPQWYFIQLQEVSGHSIRDARFPDRSRPEVITNVYDYTRERWRGHETPRLRQIRPMDSALVYNYPGDSAQSQGATTLARLRYQTEDPEVARYHQATILKPAQRLPKIQGLIETYLNGAILLEGRTVEINREPVEVPRKVFPLPAQRFGHDRVLSAPSQSPHDISNMWKTRLAWLRDKQIGPFTQTGITNQFLLVPMSTATDEALLERIQEDLTQVVQRFYPNTYSPALAIWNDQGVQNVPQLKQALNIPKTQMERTGLVCATVLLPAGWSTRRSISKLRLHIKKILHPAVRTKCLQVDEVLRFLQYDGRQYSVADNRYWSYLTFTALDILVTSGFWPWVLAEPFHYDLHIGIDVLNHTAGFTFMADGGRICRFHPSTSEQSEKLSAQQLAQVMQDHLRELVPRIKQETGRKPRHIVLFRDGHWHDTEQEGLDRAINQLQREGVLEQNVLIGVVEINKSNAERLRLMAKQNGQILNPPIGSYHVFNDCTGLLCTTGYPAHMPGTASPLIVKIVYGDLDITKVLRDVYWSSALAWTKPDGIQSNPIMIKLADDWLESFAAGLDDNEGAFDTLKDTDIAGDHLSPRSSLPRKDAP
jgi:hypothetical protein